MNIQDRGSLKSSAKAALNRSLYDPRRMILIYTLVNFLFTALVLCFNFLLDEQISSTGGLGGIGTRSMLSGLQSILTVANMILLPLWDLGYISATLRMARGETVSDYTLLDGINNVGPSVRTILLRSLILAGVAIPTGYMSAFLFFLTPWGQEMTENLTPLINDAAAMDPGILSDAMMDAFQPYVVPFLCIFAGLYLLVFLPFFYRFRMTDFLIMDAPQKGALSALRESRKMMRGNCMALFRLDLSFWWFYALEILASALAFGDLIADALGITLPLDATASYFLFFFLAQILHGALYLWRRNDLALTYANAYEALAAAAPQPPAQGPVKQPWDY